MDENPFIVCFECGHVYNTPHDLERRYAEIVMEMRGEDGLEFLPKEASEIFFCQECIHDF